MLVRRVESPATQPSGGARAPGRHAHPQPARFAPNSPVHRASRPGSPVPQNRRQRRETTPPFLTGARSPRAWTRALVPIRNRRALPNPCSGTAPSCEDDHPGTTTDPPRVVRPIELPSRCTSCSTRMSLRAGPGQGPRSPDPAGLGACPSGRARAPMCRSALPRRPRGGTNSTSVARSGVRSPFGHKANTALGLGRRGCCGQSGRFVARCRRPTLRPGGRNELAWQPLHPALRCHLGEACGVWRFRWLAPGGCLR